MTDTASTEPSEHDELKPPFKDPKPSVERIAQLAGRVLTGDILLPKFQRDFVWPKPKIIKLLDSIAKNYPIGSVLLWQSKQPLASERTIAGLSIADTKPDYPVNYLLDGQQRLFRSELSHRQRSVVAIKAASCERAHYRWAFNSRYKA